MEGGDSDFDPAAQKAALEIIRGGLRERGLRRKAPAGGAGAQQATAPPEVEEAEQPEEPIETEDEQAPEPVKRTIIKSFVPQVVREATAQRPPEQPQKRGPGRPRKH